MHIAIRARLLRSRTWILPSGGIGYDCTMYTAQEVLTVIGDHWTSVEHGTSKVKHTQHTEGLAEQAYPGRAHTVRPDDRLHPYRDSRGREPMNPKQWQDAVGGSNWRGPRPEIVNWKDAVLDCVWGTS